MSLNPKKDRRVLLLDNYDSFSYNLVHAINEIGGCELTVAKNDQIELDAIDSFEYIVLSPGPGLPSEAGILKPLIEMYASSKKILGVCLGLQAIAEVFGAKLKNLPEVFHGMETSIHKTQIESILYHGIEDGFTAGRYHSWAIDSDRFSDQLLITAQDTAGEIMSIQHKTHKVHGVQFHPESFMTKDGNKMLSNFIELA